MADGAVNFFIDATDDPLLPDQIPSFEGGQFSNLRANLLQPNQSQELGNCDIDKLGKIRTRRGTIIVGPTALVQPLGPQPDPGVTSTIQGLTSYQTTDANYIVAAHNKKIWKSTGSSWTQIATGGVKDGDEIHIYRTGKIDQSTPPTGFFVGNTVLDVSNITGIVGAGEKLYFKNNLRSDWWEYTIASASGTPTTQIILEEPGLVFDVKHEWDFIVARTATVNGDYAEGYTGAIAISDYGAPDGGTVNVGEYFVIQSENVRHRVTAASGGPPTTSITDNGTTGGVAALEEDFESGSATTPIVFAQGNDQLFFSDGSGAIYGWNGQNLMNISTENALDFLTGSTLHQNQTKPPQDVTILLWFQNRLIASGIADEPDAIYFSDYFDGTSWDRNYQKIRIGGGESDPITGLLAWTDYNLIVFKKNSCYIINLDPSQNSNPDDPTLLVASFSVKQLHKLIGCPAPDTAVQVGGGSTTPGSDVFFCDGDKKVHSIRRVMAAEQQQEIGTAVSLPIHDILDTINIDNIDKATAMYHNEHYILGFPSILGETGGTRNNAVVAYNLLTQSWCGVWTWAPTCFARRTDLGSYSKMIFGDSNGNVVQWMDDLSLQEETSTTYKDLVLGGAGGSSLRTTIVTRAITFGDYYSFKTGLSVEFEFDESTAERVEIKVYADKELKRDPITGSEFIAEPFSSLSEPRLKLPFTLPEPLPNSPSLLRKAFDLQRYGTWRELQFLITTTSGKLAIRSIRVTGFMDTIRLQTIPMTGIPGIVAPPATSGGP